DVLLRAAQQRRAAQSQRVARTELHDHSRPERRHRLRDDRQVPHPHGVAVRPRGAGDGAIVTGAEVREIALQAAQYEAQRPRIHHLPVWSKEVYRSTASNAHADAGAPSIADVISYHPLAEEPPCPPPLRRRRPAPRNRKRKRRTSPTRTSIRRSRKASSRG